MNNASACGCIGPQNGEPVCPCRMKYVTIKDGRYVSVTDLGPAPFKQEFFTMPDITPVKLQIEQLVKLKVL